MLIGVVWIVSLSISLPLAIYMKLVESKVDGVVKYQCRVSYFYLETKLNLKIHFHQINLKGSLANTDVKEIF